jgi:hypothetical protein
MSLERFRVPDLSIGATVLIVAIALPFFVFTRAEHLHRAQGKTATSATPPVELARSTLDPTAPPADPPSTSSLPVTGPSATAKGKPSASARATTRSTASAHVTTTSAPTNAPTSTATPSPAPTPTPAGAPLANIAVTVTGPLTVTADASGSTDNALTPIKQMFFDFGDGTTVAAEPGSTATHTYASSGQYYVAVTVIDSVNASSTTGQSISV